MRQSIASLLLWSMAGVASGQQHSWRPVNELVFPGPMIPFPTVEEHAMAYDGVRGCVCLLVGTSTTGVFGHGTAGRGPSCPTSRLSPLSG